MSHLLGSITDFVRGDDCELPRDVDIADILPDVLAKAWFTVKRKLSDSDGEAIIHKTITPDLTADGQIEIVGSDGVDGHLSFILTATDTLALSEHILYYYDIKAKSSGGATKVLEGGRIKASAPVTLASS